MHKALLAVVCLFLGLCCVVVQAQDDAEAATCYMAGLKALQERDFESAISQMNDALKLKPTSNATKDKLIEIYTEYTALLRSQIVSLTMKNAELQKSTDPKKQGDKAFGQERTEKQPVDVQGWKGLGQWNGSGIRTTETIHVTKQEWVISWKVVRDESQADVLGAGLYFAVMVYDSKGDMVSLEANITKPDSNTTVVHGKGDFYLTVNSFGANYAVAAWERP